MNTATSCVARYVRSRIPQLVPGSARCSEFLEVHISEDMKDSLAGIDRGFGKFRDFSTLALIRIGIKDALEVLSSDSARLSPGYEIRDDDFIAFLNRRTNQGIRTMLTLLHFASQLVDALKCPEASD